ncbi:exonuclease domain-containing protein [Pseudonocardia cypriaca]|uniref:DNA polymerase-3 subunit epsilon n=1 Tax=Pseudonocardia cypriaca TaxID=882449 RepID=A0A543GD89_9PSEU|nr:exonuclease domain-containing protein [Pseudonocardia cypriaca]TQM44014.1 DNA polymerase-3 subunit epsilon [Pseudonocardia cypriaca]
MNPARLATVAAAALAPAAVAAAVGAAVFFSTPPPDRAVLARLLWEQAAFLAVAAVLVTLVAGLLVGAALRRSVAPARRMAADVRVVLGANPEHRVTPSGPAELRDLATALNELAERHAAARRDVREEVAAAAADLERERNRLAVLMGVLTVAVLVCAEDGRILLYNAAARDLFGDDAGLGRSVFGVLDRDLVVHGLARVDAGSAPHEATAERGGRLIRVRLARVPSGTAGFVLVCEDATRVERAAARHAELLGSTADLVRGAAGSIGAAAGALLDYPDVPADQRHRFVEVIAEEAGRLGAAGERLTEEPGLDMRGRAVADISARDLLTAVAARTEGPQTRIGGAAEDVWFAVDSFSVADALASVVRFLGERHGTSEVVLAAPAGDAGQLGRLDLTWDGPPLRAGDLERAAANAAAVVRRHGGETWADPHQPLVRVLLPRSPAGPRPAARAGADESPPALYDFELERFQPGPAAWSDRAESPLDRLAYTVFDTETTGFAPDDGDEIVSIGAVRIVGGRLLRTETFERLVDPGRSIPRAASAVHGITRDLVRGAPALDEVLPAFAAFAAESVLVGHNVAFDMAFLAAAQRRTGTALAAPLLDTLLVDGVLHPDHDAHTLEAMAERLGVDLVGRHTALGDALLTGEIFLRQLPLLAARGVHTLGELRAAAAATAQARTSERLYRPNARSASPNPRR